MILTAKSDKSPGLGGVSRRFSLISLKLAFMALRTEAGATFDQSYFQIGTCLSR